jgi:hypothetical protein
MPYTKKGLPYQGHSITSQMAAHSVENTAATQRQEVLLFIQARGAQGATDEEIRDTMGIIMNSVLPRRGELVKMGSVVDSGEVRKTKQNRWATVWKAVQHCPTAIPVTKKASPKQQNTLLKVRIVILKNEIAQIKAELAQLKAELSKYT